MGISVNQLETVEMFKTLDIESLSFLENNKVCQSFKKNKPLFVEGSYPTGVFCITKGKVKVFTLGESGKEQIIRIASDGDVVGFRAMFSEEPYKLSATTLEECNICFIKISHFMEQIHEHPELLQAVLKEISKESGERAMFIKTMAQKTVRERIAIVLLVLEDIYKEDPINLSREDLANFVGTATETTIRILKEFKEDELIEINGRKIILNDTNGMKKEAGY